MQRTPLTPEQIAELPWQTPQACVGNPQNGCVDFAHLADGGAAIRNSTDPEGPVVFFTEDEKRNFLLAVKGGQYDLPGA